MTKYVAEVTKMKIAVTAKAPNLNAEVDPRFGRASYILIIDPVAMSFEALENKDNINAFRGAGIQTAIMVSDKGVEAVLTGYCGPKAFATLKAANIKIANDVAGTVKDAVVAFNKGKLKFSDQPTADAHW
jgi:predicted Fe-Mo cluster-binding NifX family protein